MPDPQQRSAPAAQRTASDVFDSHLDLRSRNDVEGDIAANYAEDVVLMTLTGTFRGHEGVRQSARELQNYFPSGKYEYVHRAVEGEVAFLVWRGRSPAGEVRDGADSFLIREGKILVQTIHYNVDRNGGG